MAGGMRRRCARVAAWWLERNPAYLLSAIAVAAGARLLLVSERHYAGDVSWILTTLGVLQSYEWAVGGLFVWLSRVHRSPEDRVSTFLIAVVFWTGPLTATMELTAEDRTAGTAAAALVGLAGLAGLLLVRRVTGLSLPPGGVVVLAALLALLVITPTRLRLPEAAAGDDALLLYAAWLVLAVLVAAGAFAAAPGRPAGPGWHAPAALLVTCAAAAAQLWGVNYAFWVQADAGFAAPALAALTFWLVRFRPEEGRWRSAALVGAACLPLVAGGLAALNAPALPIHCLPPPFDDRLSLTAVIAAGAWLLAFSSAPRPAFFHLASAALTLAFLRAVDADTAGAAGVAGVRWIAGSPTLAAYLLTAYVAACALAWRSRGHAAAALMLHYVALTLLLTQHRPDAGPLLGPAAGWTWLALVYVFRPPPAWVLTVTPVGLLLAWNFGAAYSGLSTAVVLGHAALLVAVLWGLAIVLRLAAYRIMAVVCGLVLGLFFVGRAASQVSNIGAMLLVAVAFGLLGFGAWVSWNKRRLLIYAAVWGDPPPPALRAADGAGPPPRGLPPAPADPDGFPWSMETPHVPAASGGPPARGSGGSSACET